MLLNRTNFSRQIYALGGNPEAARRVGFNAFRLQVLVYGYMGLVSLALIAIMQNSLALLGVSSHWSPCNRARDRGGRRKHGVALAQAVARIAGVGVMLGVLNRVFGQTNTRLLALLLVLIAVFGALVGDRLFGSLGLRSMAS